MDLGEFGPNTIFLGFSRRQFICSWTCRKNGMKPFFAPKISHGILCTIRFPTEDFVWVPKRWIWENLDRTLYFPVFRVGNFSMVGRVGKITTRHFSKRKFRPEIVSMFSFRWKISHGSQGKGFGSVLAQHYILPFSRRQFLCSWTRRKNSMKPFFAPKLSFGILCTILFQTEYFVRLPKRWI